MTTYVAATDALYGLVSNTWKTSVLPLLGADAELRFQGVEQHDRIPGDVFWARVSRQTIDASQSSLSACVTNIGKSRYTEYGLIFVQLFGPVADPESLYKLSRAAQILRNAFRAKEMSGQATIWFRRARINELPQEERFTRLNVVAEFEYDEIY